MSKRYRHGYVIEATGWPGPGLRTAVYVQQEQIHEYEETPSENDAYDHLMGLVDRLAREISEYRHDGWTPHPQLIDMKIQEHHMLVEED